MFWPRRDGPPDFEPPRHHRSGPFGVVDIGTTKIACLIGRMERDGTLRVLGFGWQKGRGLNSGDITDLEAAERRSALASDRPRTWRIPVCARSPST